MPDSARGALLGYLYQFLGTTALRASVTPDGAGLSAQLTAKVRAGRLIHEAVGQDAVVRTEMTPSDDTVLIQFKYSDDPNRFLSRAELIEILRKFDRSRIEAASANERVTSFVLITNRSLDADASALYAARSGTTCPSGLRLNGRSGRKPSKANQRLLEGYADPDTAASHWFDVLKELTVYERVSFAAARGSLRRFASNHGVLPMELPERVTQTVGRMLEDTINGPLEIDLSWLREHLVGAQDAVLVTFGPTSVSAAAAAVVRQRLRAVNLPADFEPIRRDVMTELEDAALRSSVVLLIGNGGCGKSVLALQYLIEAAESRVVVSHRAGSISEDTLTQEFSWLRSPSRGLRQDRTLDVVVRRLREANPGVRSVLIVDLDGLEEAQGEADERLRHLIRTCSTNGPPEDTGILLLLSCRTNDTQEDIAVDDLIRRLFDCEDPNVYRDRMPVVHVGDFSRRELAAAVHRAGVGLAAFADWLLNPDSPDVADPDLAHSSEAYSPEVVESLQHPVVLGAFAGLTEAEQRRVLQGDEVGLARLARAFLVRFSGKCRQRQLALRDIPIDAGLIAVAEATRRRPPYSRRQDWLPAAMVVIGPIAAELLFREAVTYGLVQNESVDGWRWRHSFVTDHLARAGET